jgi:hypothetical protein
MAKSPRNRANTAAQALAQKGPVTSYLSRFFAYVNRTARTRSRYIDPDIPTTTFDRISDFWKAARRWNPKKPPAQYISLNGVISNYAPVLPGDPAGKRDIHRYIRRNYNEIRKTLNEAGRREGPATLDAFMAFSSGQMVVRLSPDAMPYVYMGLYHSIVRNAIPLFVERTYYHDVIEHDFRHFAPGTEAMEAAVVGRLLPMPNDFVVEFLNALNIYDAFKNAPIDRLLPRFALQVDGGADSTLIRPLSRARYLDGDIWVAIRSGNFERVVSRFLDLTDSEDIAAEREGLKTEVANLYGACEVLSEYDATYPIFPEKHILDATSAWHAEQHGPHGGLPGMSDGLTVYNINAKEVTVSQDHINIHNAGGIVNVKSTLTNAVLKIGSASALGDRQQELQALFSRLQEVVTAAEKSRPEDAARVAQTADLVATEVAKTKPDRSFLEITTKGLVEAAKALESAAPAILSVVGAIVNLVLP